MIMMTFPALFLALFGYSAIREYKDKNTMNDEIQLYDGPQSEDRKSTRLNSSHDRQSRMPSSA